MTTLTCWILALPPPDGGSPEGGDAGGLFGGLFPFLMILLVVMLLMPLFSRKEKKRRERLNQIKKHDRVVTSGGIYGTVTAMDDDTVTLEIAKDCRVKFKRSSVFDLDKPTEAKDASDDAKKKAKAKN